MTDLGLVRKVLHLNEEPWKNMPDALLQSAFDRRNLQHFNRLELRGDRLLEVIATDLLLELPGTTAQQVTTWKPELVRNTVLFCIMHQAGLCCQIRSKERHTVKTCADSFEALLGVMYSYLREGLRDATAMAQLDTYMRKWWFTPAVLATIANGGRLDTCTYDNKDIRKVGNDGYLERCKVSTPAPMPVRVPGRVPTPAHVIDLTQLEEELPSIENLLATVTPTNTPITAAQQVRIRSLLKQNDWRRSQLQQSADAYIQLARIYKQFQYPLEQDVFYDEERKEYIAIIYILDIVTMTPDQVLGSGKTEKGALRAAAFLALQKLLRYLRTFR